MENMGSEKGNGSLRKPMRRRYHARRSIPPQDCVINMAEARREIAHALHLHRSSSSPSPSPSSSSLSAASAAASASCFMNREPTISSGNSKFNNPVFGGSQYCYSVMESMPLPEPIWSTTAPSILAAPTPPAVEAPEFEWGENQAAAYTWWLGFLKTLDNKYINHEEPKYHFGNSRILFSQRCQEGPKLGESTFLEACDQTSTDEWLMFPTTEDQGETVISPHENGGF